MLIFFKKNVFLAGFFVCLLSSLSSSAQKDSTTQLPIIEVSSVNLNRFTIGQVQLTTDSQTLRLLQQQPLQEWLMMATPLSFRTYGTGAGSVSSRGTSANHTALLWNGINIQNSLNGVIDLPTVEVGSSKVSVKMGASTALFGSGATGATILIEDEKPLEYGLVSSLNVGAGSFGYQQLSSDFKYKKRGFAGETRLSSQYSKNDFTFKNTSTIGQPIQKAVNADYDRLNLSQHFFLNLTENQFLKIHLLHSRNKRSVTPTMTSSNDNAVLRDTISRAMLEWSIFLKNTNIKAKTAWLDDNNNYKSIKIDNSQNKIQRLINEVEINKDFSQNYTFRISGNYTREQSISSNFDGNHLRNRIAVLCNQTFQKEKIGQLTINLRQEITDAKATPFTFSIGTATPIYFRKANNINIRSSFSRIYNLPSFNDLYWKNLGNANLLPEQGWSKELGLTFNRKEQNAQWNTYFTLYHINLDKQLAWLPTSDGIFKPTNLNQMRSMGIETMLDYSFQKGTWFWSVKSQYQLAYTTNKEGFRQIFVPMHNGNISLSIKYKNTMLLWNQLASSRRYMTNDNSTWVKGFSISNLSFVFSPKVKKSNLDFAIRAFNLLNVDYQILESYPNPKRNFKADVTLTF